MRDFINSPRRVMGAIFLTLALLMAIFGPTSLNGRFSSVGFVIYWFLCGALTVMAACVALVDLSRVKKESREAQHDLIEKTLQSADRDPESSKNQGKDPDESV